MHQVTLSFKTSQQVVDNLVKLQERSNSPSQGVTIRKSCAMLDMILQQYEEGGKVIFRDKDGKENDFPIDIVLAVQ